MKTPSYFTIFLLALAVFGIIPSGNAEVPEELKKIEDQYLAAIQIQVEEPHQSQLADLNSKYTSALEKAFQAATMADRLDEALALRSEIRRVQENSPLPEKAESAHPILNRFQNTYRDQVARLFADREKGAAPIVKKFDEALAALQSSLTKSGNVDDAAMVKAYREENLANKLAVRTSLTTDLLGALPATISQHLLLYYSFDDQSPIKDVSPRGNDAASTSFNSFASDGVRGGAVDIVPAQHSLVSKAPLGISGDHPRTVCAWLKLRSVPDKPYFLVFTWGDERAAGARFAFLVEKDAKIRLHGSNRDILFPVQLPVEKWTHFAVTYDSNELVVFLNGEEMARKPIVMATTDTPISIGLSDKMLAWYQPWNGLIDEFMVFDSALSKDSIRTIQELGGKK
jgi:hypothetical protein